LEDIIDDGYGIKVPIIPLVSIFWVPMDQQCFRDKSGWSKIEVTFDEVAFVDILPIFILSAGKLLNIIIESIFTGPLKK
jgi:hypothetical protein